ncbi:RNA ligase [Pseudonocardia sediminis]|uniref:RNA ligase n=1 Tax=Pseudonocardia sediminis TaxID=1397368 RepID=A0A4V2FR66_PSEST|nr:RNA ligase [Pseudonocardia sediminis]RZT87500.1 RNA ligase [Pseudonocardia sediminis]
MQTAAANITDLFGVNDLDAAIAAGHVKRQEHPTLPLSIYNYTDTCQWDSAWTPVTRTCRGLIVDAHGGIVARPFPKVHNHHEPNAPTIDGREAVEVTDKVDGSLGILYPADGEYGIATRGSFTSEQAQHATALWAQRYTRTVCPIPGVTTLFEIVYPANRIVIDYAGQDDLVLLGGVRDHDGQHVPAWRLANAIQWPGPVVEAFAFGSYADALAAAPRPGREGFVVRSIVSGAAVKVKQADYVALHRIVTGLNARTVWERLGEGDDIADLISGLPDEFHGWVSMVARDLQRDAAAIEDTAGEDHTAILRFLPAGWTRKDYAMVAKDRPNKAYLFRLLDGRGVSDLAWREVKPSADHRPSNLRCQTEDAA